MRIGQKIKQVRLHRGMTQKELGIMVGLDKKTADIRIAQYESSVRTPKAAMKERLAAALGVNPNYFCDFDIHTAEDIILFLFEIDGVYKLDFTPYSDGIEKGINIHVDCKMLDDFLADWRERKEALSNGDINTHDYTEWLLNRIESINKRGDSACQN